MIQTVTHPRWTRAEAYIDDVARDRAAAGQLERLAVARHLRDMDAAAFEDWPYKFDRDRAERACRLIEMLPHVQGEWASRRETIRLEGVQAFIVGSLFGWVRKDTGARRFRTGYIEMARKNAKSTVMAGAAIYLLAFDGEYGAEVYSAATTKDQARKVFNPARQMLLRSPSITAKRGIDVQVHRCVVNATNSVFEPLASQTNSLDGANPHGALIDELHAHKSREVWDVLGSGMGARRQPLRIAITTAGSDLHGVCYAERTDVEKILRNVVQDDTYFGVIFALDEGDDPLEPANWRKANPLLGVSVSEEYLRAEARKAARDQTRLGEFMRKHCCVWTAAGVAALDLERFRAGAEPALALEDLAACEGVIVGLDGSKTDDFTSVVVAGWRGDDLLIWDEHWATEDTVRLDGNEQLEAWRQQGWLHMCPGALIDLDQVEARLREVVAAVSPDEVAYDPMYLAQMATRLSADLGDDLMVEQRQNTTSLDPALRYAQGLVRERRVRHRGNPVMEWMVSNTRAKPAGEFLKLFKQVPYAKIDGVSAWLTALARMERPDDAPAAIEIPDGYRVQA